MANSKCRWECPQQWSQWSEWLAAGGMDCSAAERSGKNGLDCDRRWLHEAAVLAACFEDRRHDRRSPAQRRRAERFAAEVEKRGNVAGEVGHASMTRTVSVWPSEPGSGADGRALLV